MDGAKLQTKVYAGLGKAAKVLGLPFDVYRLGPGSPTLFDPANKVDHLPAQFTVTSTSGAFQNAPKFDATWFDALLDGARVQAGDVLVNATAGTFYILSKMPLLPIKAARCNETIAVSRARIPGAFDFGDLGYSGHVASPNLDVAGEDTILSGVPCASSSEGYGRAIAQGLTASDSPGPTKWFFYLPPYVRDGAVRERDIIVDSHGNRYQVAIANWAAFNLCLQCVRLQT